MKRLQYIAISALAVVPSIVFAQSTGGSSSVGFSNPLNASTICDVLKIGLNALLTIAMPIGVLFLVYAGFKLVFARGNPKQLQVAKRNLFWVIVGIGIFMGCWVLGQILANTLNSLATQSGQQPLYIGSCTGGAPQGQWQNGTAPL